VDQARAHGLHMVQPVLALPDHLAVFERGIANRLDFAFAGPQSRKLAELVEAGRLKIGAIHTYLELYARMMVDLTPHVALVVADKADGQGNLYTGPNTEDTPTLVEATAFRGGIVVAQVNEIVEHLPRVDIPGDWVDVVVPTARPYAIEPLFTRDPAKIREDKILMAMMAIAAVYEPYEIRRLNHGIGYATAAIELILPTFGAARGLEGKVATHFVLNPHPTLIPAIEAGSVERIYCFGSELGMERYMAAHPDVFPVGRDGSLRSNRALAQVAGHYACDLFIGGTLQIDARGNSSTATRGRIAGFGGAPNMGADARGRRHPSPAWLRAGREAGEAQVRQAVLVLADEIAVDRQGQAENEGRDHEKRAIDRDVDEGTLADPLRKIAHVPRKAGEQQDGKDSQAVVQELPQPEPVSAFEVGIGETALLRRDRIEPGGGRAIDVECRTRDCLFGHVQPGRQIAHDGSIGSGGDRDGETGRHQHARETKNKSHGRVSVRGTSLRCRNARRTLPRLHRPVRRARNR